MIKLEDEIKLLKAHNKNLLRKLKGVRRARKQALITIESMDEDIDDLLFVFHRVLPFVPRDDFAAILKELESNRNERAK